MQVRNTSLEGLLIIDLDIIEDERGSFREAWQTEKMTKAGMKPLEPLQYNVSVNKRGVIRGIHAEPWDKYVHVVHGRGFAALVDLRKESPTFGQYESLELNPSNAIYLPTGFGNSFQALADNTVYTYLVTQLWQADLMGKYPAVAFDDPALAIPWPLPESEWIVSEKDRNNPTLKEAYGS